MGILDATSIGEILQRILLASCLSATVSMAALRLINKQGGASTPLTIGLLLMCAGGLFSLLDMAVAGEASQWPLTWAFAGGSLVMFAREQDFHRVKRRRPWVAWLAICVLFVVGLQAVLYADRWTLGPQPSYRVDSIAIADGQVGQVNFEFTVRGQRLTPCGTDYDYVVYDVGKKKFRKSGTLKGRQAGKPGPTTAIVFDQPIGPFREPGTLEYRFSPVDRCGDKAYEHPQSTLRARFEVTK